MFSVCIRVYPFSSFEIFDLFSHNLIWTSADGGPHGVILSVITTWLMSEFAQ
jgi:hypothetical protein